ncbi:MAG: hypothetical protein HQM10_07735 [Candidatus Riflebacteria bacterium]|nr:hypothetical protein [Candidatus Riflebacteria bacterium]
MKKNIEKILSGILGIASAIPGYAQMSDNVPKIPVPVQGITEQSVPKPPDKEEILQSLRDLNRTPEKIEIRSAMCYDMVQAPETVDFACPDCGKNNSYSRDTFPGEVSMALSQLLRLEQTPFKIKTNAKAFCTICGNGRPKELIMSLDCVGCRTKLGWKISEKEEIQRIHIFFRSFPITYFDEMTDTGFEGNSNTEKLRSIASYVYSRLFCPDCQKRNPVDMQSDLENKK